MIEEQRLKEVLIAFAEFSKRQYETIVTIQDELAVIREAVLEVNPKLADALEHPRGETTRTAIRDKAIVVIDELIWRLKAEINH